MKSLIILISVLVISCSQNTPCNCQDCVNPLVDYTATVTIARVVDGDTYTFFLGNDSFSIRLLGIDCFETRHGSRLDSQAAKHNISSDSALSLGKIAKEFMKGFIEGKQVQIFRDSSQSNFDTYNRLLRAVKYKNKFLKDTLIKMKFGV